MKNTSLCVVEYLIVNASSDLFTVTRIMATKRLERTCSETQYVLYSDGKGGIGMKTILENQQLLLL